MNKFFIFLCLGPFLYACSGKYSHRPSRYISSFHVSDTEIMALKDIVIHSIDLKTCTFFMAAGKVTEKEGELYLNSSQGSSPIQAEEEICERLKVSVKKHKLQKIHTADRKGFYFPHVVFTVNHKKDERKIVSFFDGKNWW